MTESLTPTTAEEIAAEIVANGDKIKLAKAEKKPKEDWEEFLQAMLTLKVRAEIVCVCVCAVDRHCLCLSCILGMECHGDLRNRNTRESKSPSEHLEVASVYERKRCAKKLKNRPATKVNI